MHVAVGDFFGVQQRTDLAQLFDDQRIGFPDVEAAEERKRGRVTAVALHWIQYLVVGETVAPARLEVIDAVCRRAVHDAGPLLQGDEFAKLNRRFAVVERVAKTDALERSARRLVLEPAGRLPSCDAEARKAGVDQLGRQDEAPSIGLDQRIDEVGMHGQRLIGRDGPRRRRPDDRARRTIGQLLKAERARQCRPVARIDFEADVDRDIGAVLVFHFGFR